MISGVQVAESTRKHSATGQSTGGGPYLLGCGRIIGIEGTTTGRHTQEVTAE